MKAYEEKYCCICKRKYYVKVGWGKGGINVRPIRKKNVTTCSMKCSKIKVKNKRNAYCRTYAKKKASAP